MADPTEGSWKGIAMFLAGIILGLVTYIWNDSRDRVTRQDLASMQSSMISLQGTVGDLSQQLAGMRGEMKGRDELNSTGKRHNNN